jgi:hypothetical protein
MGPERICLRLGVDATGSGTILKCLTRNQSTYKSSAMESNGGRVQRILRNWDKNAVFLIPNQ